MSNVIQFPSQDYFLIAVATDDETGEEIILLDQVIMGVRTEVGEYQNMFEVNAAMDAIMGIVRPEDHDTGGTAA